MFPSNIVQWRHVQWRHVQAYWLLTLYIKNWSRTLRRTYHRHTVYVIYRVHNTTKI